MEKEKEKENPSFGERASQSCVVVGGPGAVTARGRAQSNRIKCKGLGRLAEDVST